SYLWIIPNGGHVPILKNMGLFTQQALEFLTGEWEKNNQPRPAAPAAAEVVSGELGQKIDRYMTKAEANGYAGSVLVARGEKIILAKGYGLADRESKRKQTAETVFSVGSITKQFTGAAILKLEIMDKLSVADPITKYFGDVPPDKKAITLHHLLTHTAGFAGALGDDYDPVSREDYIKLALGSKLIFEPGARYEYSNVGFSLLGIIMELVSRKNYEDFLYEALFKPAGMERTGYVRPKFTKHELAVGYTGGERWGTALDRPWRPEGPGWHLRANGGILSTVRDMHRWYLALRKDTVLSAAARQKYFAPHVKEYEDGNSYYGYGWVTQKTESGANLIWHNGGNGIYNAFMGFEPENDLVIIASSNIAGKISDNYAERIGQIVAGSFKELDEAMLKEYTGTYRLLSDAEFEVRFDENDTLTASYTAKELVGLFAASGKEVKEEVERHNEKVKGMLNGLLAGDYAALAAAWGEPVEEVKARASVFWGEKRKRFGEIRSFDVLGTVARPRNLITYVRFDFAQSPRFFTYVWEKEPGRLMDLRESEKLERQFEPKSQNEFSSPPIGATILFEKDSAGNTKLTIKKGEAIARATKLSSHI
ncbi:MAG: serine hydrolase domain-containing protein, partial [Acidobacteriota bacterium]